MRLPAALASVAEVAVTAALGEAMFGAAIGLAAAMVLALSPLVFGFARFATLDPALALFVTAALGAFWAAARAPGFDSAAGRRWFLLSAAMTAAGTLTKGPVALVLTGAVGLAWLAGGATRARDCPDAVARRDRNLYVAVAAPWFVIASRRNPEFLRFFFIHEHVERYLENTEHGWGPYFFVMVVIAGMWPWIFFVPIGRARADACAARATMKPDDPRGGRMREARSRLRSGGSGSSWSSSRSRAPSSARTSCPRFRRSRSWPAMRSAACLDSKCRAVRRLFGALALLNLAATAAVAIARVYFASQAAVRAACRCASRRMAALTAASFVGLAIAWRGRNVAAATGALALGVTVALGVMVKARMDAQPLGSYRELAHAIDAVPRPRMPPGVISPFRPIAAILHRPSRGPGRLSRRAGAVWPRPRRARELYREPTPISRRLWRGPGCAVLVVNRSDLPHIRALLGSGATIVGCEGKKLALYNRAIAEPANGAPVHAGSSSMKRGLGFTAR